MFNESQNRQRTGARLLAKLEREAKQQPRVIYQQHAKEIVAAFYNLPFDHVDLPFEEWMKLRKRYEVESGKSL